MKAITPKFSIITINYNNLEGLKKTFDSVFMQTYQDFEYIVIDGGSTDGSKELIKQNADKITHWVSESDKGIYDALNKGIKIANGEFIIFINSGDSLFEPNTLKILSEADSKYDVVYGNTNLIFPDGKEIIKIYPENCDLLFFLKDTVQHQGTRIKKELFSKNIYSTEYKIISDWAWFFDRFIEKNSFFYINEVIANFVLDGISSTNVDLLQEERIHFLKNNHFDYFLIHEEIANLRNDNYRLKHKVEKIYSSKWMKFLKKLKLIKL